MRTRIAPMRKTKILLSVLGALSKALVQQGQLIDRDVHLCAEIVPVFVFVFLKNSLTANLFICILYLYPLILSHLRSTASWTGDRSLFLGLRGRKNTGGRGGNKRLQSGPLTCIHLYGVRVHIQYISLMCACTCAFAYILNNNNNS